MNRHLLFLDFESAYDSRAKFDLRHISIVEYVRSPKFKVFGMGVALGHEKVLWITAPSIPGYIDVIAKTIGWPNIALVGQNVKFDAFILHEVYEVIPGSYVDTKGMSKAVLGKSVKGHSLQILSEHFGLKHNGTTGKGEMKTDGLTELTAQQEAALAEYCLGDVDLTRQLFNKLAPDFPENQYPVLHRTVDMFVNPKMQLNVPLLEKTSKDEAERRTKIFDEIGIPKAEFASNVKFPKLLESRGFDVPMKASPRKKDENGEPVRIPALALGDVEFLELLESQNEELRSLCEARVAAKSTLLETRSAKLAAIGRTGRWPFDIEFSGADQTHRFSGGKGAGGNPQNFTRGSALRTAVEAPPRYELVVGDFANIELRIVAYLSRDPGLVQAIEQGVDLYCDIASVFYGRRITEADKKQRQFGKCLAEGTLVLTDKGWKKIETITTADRVWDGEEWAQHQGLVKNGVKETIGLRGLWLTPDHRVWSGMRWRAAQSLAQDGNGLYRALAFAKANLPLQDISEARETGWLPSWLHAPVVRLSTRSMLIISRVFGLHVAPLVPENRPQTRENSTGDTPKSSRMTPIESGCLTASVPPSLGVTTQRIVCTALMEGEGFGYFQNGELTEVCSSDIYLPLMDGITRVWRWIGSTIITGMNRAISVLVHGKKTLITDDGSKILKRKLPVYDLLSVGLRNRFTVLTSAGPLVVHNCAILGLGYGMGWKKFKRTVRLQTGESIADEDAKRAVDLYRTRYGGVKALWDALDNTIQMMAMPAGDGCRQFTNLPVKFGRKCVVLPSGLKIRYSNLRSVPSKDFKGQLEWVYDAYNKGRIETHKLYGAKVLENISQAIAGNICTEAMMRVRNVVLQVHDELGVLCKRGLGFVTQQHLKRAMTLSPKWLPQIKLGAKVSVGRNWNAAK